MPSRKSRNKLKAAIDSAMPLLIWAKHRATLLALGKIAKDKGLDLAEIHCPTTYDFDIEYIHNTGNFGDPLLNLPTSGKGILVFTDFPHATPSASKMCQCLVFKRAYGKYKLPIGWSLALVGAEQDRARLTETLSGVIMRRLNQITLQEG